MSRMFFYNANVRTMDPARPRAASLLVENGRILAVGGNRAALAAARGAPCIDLEGKTLLPGFIDGHSHLVANSYRRLFADARPGAGSCGDLLCCIASLQKQFKAWLPARRPGQWFVAMGLDESFWPRAVPPTRYDLDQISTEVPVCVVHASGHAAVFNSCALALCGITRDTRCPEGGGMPRLENGEFSGLLQENAFFAQRAHFPQPSLPELLKALKGSCQEYLSYGITTAQDAKVTQSDLPLLRTAQGLGLFPLDVALYFDPDAAQKALPKRCPAQNRYFRHVRAAGCKLFLDGSPQARTAWLSEPYFIPPEGKGSDYRGFAAMSDEALCDRLEECFANHWQVNVHTNGDEAIEQLLRCWGAVSARHPGAANLRPVFIHCQTVRPDQLDRIAALGMCISFFSDHVYYWGDYHADVTLGMARAARISPVKSALARGIPCTIHEDTPVVPPNILLAVQNAVLRRTRSGRLLGAEECLTVQAALECVTRAGAYQLFEEKRKGTLTPGKLADMVLLDTDPFTVPPDEIAAISVLATLKNGRCIWQAPR